MTLLLRPRVALSLLAAALLMSLVATTVDARVPRATRYHAGGPITLDTNLRSASGASAWAIDKYLKAATPLPPLGAAFIAAEKKYGVNARFLLAAALHESGWGTSYISRVKHNLFGYNAYDRDPFRYANAYATYAANIDATAKFIKDFYLTPSGRWWGGAATLRSMQQFWSSSHSWGIGVSRIATSIHLDAIAGQSITFAAPVVSGRLHGGDQASVRLAWTGGAIPAAVEFVATWEPVELDSEVIAAAISSVATGDPGAAGAIASPSASATLSPAAPTQRAQGHGGATSVAARRVRTANGSVSLAVAAPRAPGTYLLDVEMRDSGRGPLPAAQQVDIPRVEVRIWGDRAASIDVVPSLDGTGAVVRVTNTGRKPIPAMPSPTSLVSRDPADEGGRSVVTVTATTGDPVNAAPVVLVASPLVADLLPGASVSFDVPGISAATGRTTNWLSVNLSVLGDATSLAAYSPVGAWFSDAGVGATAPAAAAAQAGVVASEAPTTVAPAATPTPKPTATPTPKPTATPTPKPTATPSPSRGPTSSAARAATPSPVPSLSAMPAPTASPVPTPAATRAPAPVTRSYSERSGAISYRGSWGNAPHSGYIGGNVAWSKTPGSTATFTFTGSSVSWTGPKGPTRGLALVLLDGRAVARVDMWNPSFVARALLYKRSFGAVGRHTLTIKVLATPSHPYVAIDGFTVKS